MNLNLLFSFVCLCVCICMCIFCYLANPLSLHNKSFHLGEVVVVGDHIGDDGLLIGVLCVYICQGQRAEESTSAHSDYLSHFF